LLWCSRCCQFHALTPRVGPKGTALERFQDITVLERIGRRHQPPIGRDQGRLLGWGVLFFFAGPGP
jgi:hypothetical protein